MKWCKRAVVLMGALAAVGAAGCAATVGAEGGVVYGYPTVYAEATPVDLTIYPRVYYRGSYAYLVDGYWYYPTARGWVVFREEPVELYRYRTRYMPPDYRRPAPGYRSYPSYPAYPHERPRRYYPR